MRRITSEFGGVRASIVNRLRRLEGRTAARRHHIWLEQGESLGPKRDALIASGQASPNDHFVAYAWKPAPEVP
jgi:hypothetical protein